MTRPYAKPPHDQDEVRGTTAVGYSVLVALICGAIVVAVTTVGTGLNATFDGIAAMVRAVD